MWASTRTAGDPGSDIVILGAGIAALVAAYELESLGHRTMILEGSERIGGRIHTHRFGTAEGAPYAELGAMRIPLTHELTMRYVEKLGLKTALRPFRTILSDENNYLSTGSGFVRVKDAAGPLLADLRREVPTESYGEATVLFGAWMAAAVRAMAPAELRDNLPKDLTDLLRLADRVDLTPFRRGDRSDRMDLGAVFRAHPELRMGCGPRLFAFLDDLLLETGSGLMRIDGGMSRLTEGLAARVQGPILTGQEVLSLEVRPETVALGLRHDGRRSEHHCPAVLCTLPFSVLRDLELAGLDDDKRDVISGVDYGGATKIALHCREAFWEQDGTLGGASATGGRTRQTYYPPNEGDRRLGAALLGSYAIAEDADLLGRHPEDVRHAAVVDELSVLYPQLKDPGMVLGAAGVAWTSNRWSKGCTARRWQWGKDAQGHDTEMRRAARPQGRLFFAGEHCSSTPAWINGAIESALGAVKAIDTVLRSSR